MTRGLIRADEAEAARVEVARRLISAAEQEGGKPLEVHRNARRASAIIALVGLPLVAAAVYLWIGAPWQPDAPWASRAQMPVVAGQQLEDLVQKVETHLEQDPTDGRGWDVLAPVLLKLGRFDDAVRAMRNAIAYNPESGARRFPTSVKR